MTAGRKNHGQSQEWGSPFKIVSTVKSFFDGQIDLDPCSNEHSIVGSKVAYRLPTNDGLVCSWEYQRIYVNPPYGRDPLRKTSIYNWLGKCAKAHRDYGSEIIALVPVATNTKHWKQFVFGSANSVCFLADTRLKFLVNGVPSEKGAPMACALVYWGVNQEKFRDKFQQLGAVVKL
jgi:hypothetical protein